MTLEGGTPLGSKALTPNRKKWSAMLSDRGQKLLGDSHVFFQQALEKLVA
jgi:hypothetical protein